MPNTLCHIALQGPVSRIASSVSLPFIFAACIIPDIPWIILRLFAKTNIFPLYDLRLYATAQASLVCCLILALAMSFLAKNVWLTFLVSGANCLLHLLFDAVQVKWANGVHLLGPLSWDGLQLNYIWPENAFFIVLSFLGVGYVLFFWREAVHGFGRDFFISRFRGLAILVLTGCWLVVPLYFISGVEKAGNHYILTLRDREHRMGKYIEIDREPFDFPDKTITTRTGDTFILEGNIPDVSGILSIRGVFQSEDVIRCGEYHLHSIFRYGASFIGLFMCCTMWIQSLIIVIRKKLT